jgi:DNA mismatch repair protein MutL
MIRRLPPRVVERISAGEVVERPASVVKELVENALDAGATEITVAIERGGLGLIRVADDGGGIAPADLPLAFASHATSKLADVDDLFHIGSFGFRGEALASIAAVSRSRVVSRARGETAGQRVEAAAGEIGAPQPAACAPGTSVEVRDLFFNTPARRRFLGSESAEGARCREMVASLSLAHPGVRFRFEADGQLRFGGDGAPALADRAAAVYGRDFVEQLVPVSGGTDGLRLQGLLSLPSAARSRARCQQLFVNARAVRDRAVLSAVRSACQDFLPGALQPSWILCLTVDPERVDVNVHPTKAEVRFRDGDAVFRLLRASCRAALLAADLAPRVHAEALPLAAAARDSFGGAGAGAAASAGLRSGVTAGPPAAEVAHERPVERAALLPGLGDLRPAGRFLQVLDTYLVHDSPDGLVLIDQHALHERILYSRLQSAAARGALPVQALLVPEVVRLDPTRREAALEARDELARLGLRLEPRGDEAVAITAVPAVLRGESLAELLSHLIDPPEAHGGIPHGLDRRLFTLACHAAIKAGDPLGETAIADLLRQGEELEHDATCPHGRPTRLVVPRAELERLFKRSGF